MSSRAWYRYVGRPASHTMTMRLRAFFRTSSMDVHYRRQRYASLSWPGTAFSIAGILLLASVIVATIVCALLFQPHAIAIVALGAMLNLMLIITSNVIMHIHCENPPDHTWEAAITSLFFPKRKDS